MRNQVSLKSRFYNRNSETIFSLKLSPYSLYSASKGFHAFSYLRFLVLIDVYNFLNFTAREMH